MVRLNFLVDINHFLTSLGFSLLFSLPQDYLNVRGHISAYVRQTEGPGGLTVVVIVMVTAQIY